MTPPPLDDILAGLNTLQHAGDLPQTQRSAARHLARRMTSAVRVVVLGPVPEANDFLYQGLLQAGGMDVDQAALSVHSGSPEAFDFGTCDLVLWATFVFGPDEATVWSTAPVMLQDRSVLVPLLPDARASEALLTDLRHRAADAFDTVHPVPMKDATQPIAALVQHVARRIAEGRRADLDHATLLMGRYKPTNVTPAPPPQPTAATPSNTPIRAAAQLLQDHALDLNQRDLTEGAGCISALLRSCEETAEALCDLLEGHHPGIYADAMQAYDDIVLMALEQDITAATDAVSTLMHLRRDLHIELAS